MNLKGLRLPFDGETPLLSIMYDESGKTNYATYDIIGEETLNGVLDWLLGPSDQMYFKAKEVSLVWHQFPKVQYTISQLDSMLEKDGRDRWMITTTDPKGSLVRRVRLQKDAHLREMVINLWAFQVE